VGIFDITDRDAVAVGGVDRVLARFADSLVKPGSL
jgi:hypothetical protein